MATPKHYKRFWMALRDRGTLTLQFRIGDFSVQEVKEEVSKYKQGISREKNRDPAFNRDAKINFEVITLQTTVDLHATLVEVCLPTIKD